MLKLDLQDTGALTQAGLIPGIPIEEYHSGPGVSKSQLDKVDRSLLHYIYSLEKEDDDETKEQRFGRAFHSFILEPELGNVIVEPVVNKKTNDGKAILKEFYLANAGKNIVTPDELVALQGMKKSVLADPDASALVLSPGRVENSAYWYDKKTGLLCRCRPDKMLDNGICIDLKSAADASPEGFAKAVANQRYHVQDPFYSDGIKAATGQAPKGFVFIAVEKKPPYAVGVYQLDDQAIEEGRAVYRKNLLALSEAKCTNIYRGYTSRITTLSLPRWAIKETRSYE